MFNLLLHEERAKFYILCMSLVYHAIYLEDLTAVELTEKIAQLFSISPQQISQIFKLGPTGIHVLVSDEVSRTPLPNPLQYLIRWLVKI